MRILIIGFGSIARKHVIAIKKIAPDAKIYALRSSKNKIIDFEDIQSVYDWQEIPKNIDFVIISNPTSKHFETIKKAVSLKVPLFIEKPVLATLNGAQELLQKIKENRIITFTACNLRFHPSIVYLKKVLNKKKPLEYNSYSGSYLPEWRPNQDYRKNYSAIEELGGGVHLDLIHEIDLSYYLLGNPINTQSYKSKKSDLEINSKDIAHYVLEYSSTSAFITLNYYRRDPKRNIELIWDNDSWFVNLLDSSIVDSHNNLLFMDKSFNFLNTYYEQMNYFIQNISGRKKPMNSFEEGLETLNIALDE